MKKSTIIFLACSVLVIIGILIVGISKYNLPHNNVQTNVSPAGIKDSSYIIEGTPISLKNGLSEIEAAPGSASKVITKYFGNEARGDLNGDGKEDTVFLLTQNPGGSGTFYYVVVALKTAEGYVGTNGVLLGDRIAPQTTEIHNGEIVVNYADRNINEPMTTPPSLGVSKYLIVANGVLEERVTPAPVAGGKISGRVWASQMCTEKGGQWSEEYGECVGIDQALCTQIGGEFNECASACRHDPSAKMCTMQCVVVCTVK